METQTTEPLITIYVDGQAVHVPKGMNVIEAAAKVKTEIPHYCYHPKLSISGNCRMCLVEMGMPLRDRATGEPVLDENGNPKIGWMPKPVIACATQAAQGMHILTKSKLAKESQEGVMEFLLANHPLDCPICDQAGECRLQEFAMDYGKGHSRFIEDKTVKPKRTPLGPRVMLDDERCILCSRCIRFCQEVVKDDVLGFVDRGSYSTLTCYPGKELANNYSLNTVDICPVGALTSTDFRFKMRVWFLKKTPSICTESSVGVNTEVSAREGKIYRITPRRNDSVNDCWMSDSGRGLYKAVTSETRIRKPLSNGTAITMAESHIRVQEVIGSGRTAFVGSSHMSLEEQYLLKQILDTQKGVAFWVSHIAEGDGLLISADKTPNLRGALLTGLIDQLPKEDLSALGELIDAKKVDNLFVVHEDLLKLGLTETQLKRVNIVYCGTHHNQTSTLAQLVVPLLSVFERSGTFVNQQFRLQKFHQAVPGPAGIMPDLNTFGRILSLLKGEHDVVYSPELLWFQINQTITQLRGIRFNGIPGTGLLLDGSAFDHLDFPEKKTLHYDPQPHLTALKTS